MRIALAIVGCVLAFATCASAMAGARCVVPGAPDADVSAIRALEDAGAESNVRGQSLADAEQMFAPEFVSVGKDGAVKTRAEILEAYRDGRRAPWASAFALKSVVVKVYGDAATVVGAAEAIPLNAPAAMPPLRFRYLNVWTRTDGDWRLSATQFTTY